MAIDRKKIISALSKLEIKGNSEGLVPAYNVFVTQLPAAFWNSFAEKFTRMVSGEMLEPAEYLLVNAAHECGYHTGYGIITSDEWKAVVAPMVEKVPEDVLHGAYAVFTAWGWAKSEIVELVPRERMVVRAYDYYEAGINKYGTMEKMSAYMIRGVSAAFMDLAYGKPYPDGLKTYSCRQVKGIECGDEYGEFIVEKRE